MLQNILMIAIRNLRKNILFSIINVSGLSIGIAACVVILLFIQYELSYENMHSDKENIYRVLTIDHALGTNRQRVGITMPALGHALTESFPEVRSSLRLTSGGQALFMNGENLSVYAQQFRSADSNFFDFFNYPLLAGDPATALRDPFSIVLTQSLADQLFPNEDPMGKQLRTGNGNDLLVTGILEDLPNNTHLEFDALGSIATLETLARQNQPPDANRPIWLELWGLIAMPTYVQFYPGTDLTGMDDRMTQLCRDNNVAENFDITLQAFTDVHLRSTDVIFDPVQNKGDINNVYTFALIAVLILLIASVNYMNLSTAKSAQRAKEVGLRKVVGSRRSQLIVQFIGESLLITLLATLLAIPAAIMLLPWLNTLADTTISFNLLPNPLLSESLIGIFVLVGILAGLYPALVLANYQPITVLKGSFRTGKKGAFLRKSLVLIQFTLSIALICMTFIIQKQLFYIQNRDIGYDREQVAVFDMFDRNMSENLLTFRDELSQHSAFVSVATSGNIPGRTFGRTRIRPEGASEDDIWIWNRISVSPETVPTLGMEMALGRNFSREFATDTGNVVLINETAVQQLGWDEPLGKRLYFGQDDSTGTEVIGVVKDFNFIGIHQFIEPVVMFPMGSFPGSLLTARIAEGRIQEAMAIAEEKWNTLFPDHPFAYGFMDDEFEAIYRRDLNTGVIVNVFSLLAIFIACLGLFGLAGHSTAQRTKEIGVRKVLGASSITIVRILIIDFVKWVAFSNLLAWPLAWYASNHWLEGFAYRTELTLLPFAFATLISLFIAIITVFSQSYQAASSNPVKALRYE